MNDKEKAEVMIAAHEGKQIERSSKRLEVWEPEDNPGWQWADYDYRVAPEKPEPLELWVNKDAGGMGYAYDEKEMAESSERVGRFERQAVHMREVVPVEPLEHARDYPVGGGGVCRIAQKMYISDDEGYNITFPTSEIPALIEALQGLMAGKEKSDE